jgi:hypothetical protein
MTPKRMTLLAVLVLIVAFLSPIAYLAGQRAGVWLTTPAVDRSAGPWPSLEEGELDPGGMGERLKSSGSGVANI